MSTQRQRQEWRDDADELAKRAPMTPFVGLAIDCSAAIVALLADVDALQAEREALAAELERVRAQLAGGKPEAPQAENDKAALRLQRIDALYMAYGNDTDKWPYFAQERYAELDAAQRKYEATYC